MSAVFIGDELDPGAQRALGTRRGLPVAPQLVGRDADAEALIASHAFADSDEDDAHHALWRSINNLPPVEHDPSDDNDEKKEAGL